MKRTHVRWKKSQIIFLRVFYFIVFIRFSSQTRPLLRVQFIWQSKKKLLNAITNFMYSSSSLSTCALQLCFSKALILFCSFHKKQTGVFKKKKEKKKKNQSAEDFCIDEFAPKINAVRGSDAIPENEQNVRIFVDRVRYPLLKSFLK